MTALHNEYRTLLEDWIPSAMPYVFTPPDRPDLRYYGTGTNIWGIQTHQKGFAPFAVLAADPDTDEKRAGLSREELLEIALAMLRFTLESHYVGSYHCMDNDTEKWGHHWLSPLAIERMMHGVDAIWEYLTDTDRALLRRMLLSECDWVVDNRPVQADPVSPNVPESNLWNGAILHRTALLYPDAPRADAYREHGTRLLLNSISIPSDAHSGTLFDGKPLSEWFVGANFFESYALNHHGYLNIGYMVICLSNIAMLHFSCRQRGLTPPAALYQHMEGLWRLVKACLFDDGRLLRIGGDTRVRYCYCQDYLVPALLMAADCLSEDTRALERGWLGQVRREMAYNGDGSFLSKRCELFEERSPLYYTRLESDRACTLSMAAYWRRVYDEAARPAGTAGYQVEPGWQEPLTSWSDPYHGACLVRDQKRIASFAWRAAEPPTALCASPLDSSLVEWRNNLTSFVEGNGFSNTCEILTHKDGMFDGGFVTAGCYNSVTEGLLEENDSKNTNTRHVIAYAALPDGRTVVTLQYARALRRCHLVRIKPLHLMIPNDVFNGFKRTYTEGEGWLQIDGRLSVISVYGGQLTTLRPEGRQIGIKSIRYPNGRLQDSLAYANRGCLHCDEICISPSKKPMWFDKGETIYDFGCVVVTEQDAAAIPETVQAARAIPQKHPDCRAVQITGQDGKRYVVAANFSDGPAECRWETDGRQIDAMTAIVIDPDGRILGA